MKTAHDSIKALEVAKYILHFAYKRGDLITNLKLQKLLYYVQAWYLAKSKGKPLFSENIEAWQYGPVVKEVYDIYKCFGHNPINDESLTDKFNLNEKLIRHIDSVLDNYMDYSASTLVKSIHQDSPWLDTYSPNETKVISCKDMYNFYKKMFLPKEKLRELADTPLTKCVRV